MVEELNVKGKIKVILAYDTIFKSIFLESPDILFKMISQITNVEVTAGEILPGYETIPLKEKAKVYRSDILVKMSKYSYVLIEMNYRKDREAITRNILQLTKILNQVLEKGTEDKELSKYSFILINFNNFEIGKEKSKGYDSCFLKNDEGKIITKIYEVYNINLVKCQRRVYNEDVRKLPYVVRWGAIMLEEDNKMIEKILGKDMLKREEKERLIMMLKEIKGKDRVMTDLMWEEHYRLKEAGELRTAREDGLEEGKAEGSKNTLLNVIKSMLKEKLDYSIISKTTGKSISEIKSIESSMQSS